MSISATANVVRWTRTRIEKAIRCPKPKHAMLKAMEFNWGTTGRCKDPKALRALRHIANNADLLDVPTPADTSRHCDRWLLIRAPEWLIDALAMFEAGLDDLEADQDAEDDGLREPEQDDEGDSDGERSHVSPISGERMGPSYEGPDIAVSEAQRERLRCGDGWSALRDATAWLANRKNQAIATIESQASTATKMIPVYCTA